MTTKEFINCVKGNVSEEYYFTSKNKSLKEADQLTKDGYGQSNRNGGYLKKFEAWKKKEKIFDDVQATQHWHLICSWGELENPQIFRLKCPQLMIYIAEICGWSKKCIENAVEELKKYEDGKKLRNTSNKGGNYLEVKAEGSNITQAYLFKESLRYNHLCKIIDESASWEEIQSKCRNADIG